MNTNEQTNTKAWLWLPTVYFTRGLPYVIVFLVSLVFFNRMGQSNSTITLITSWAFVPFIMRPLLGRFVTGYATKRLWVLAMELLMAVSMFGISQSITTPYWEIASMLFIFTTACAAVIHDVAVARFYKLSMSRKLPSLSSVHSVFLLMAIVVGMGIPLMLAGNLEVLNRVVEKSWVTTFYFLAITFLLLFIYHTIMLPRPQTVDTHSQRTNKAMVVGNQNYLYAIAQLCGVAFVSVAVLNTRRNVLPHSSLVLNRPRKQWRIEPFATRIRACARLGGCLCRYWRQPFRSLCHTKARTVEQPLAYGVRHYIAQDAVYLP